MALRYFQGVKSRDEAKARYRELAKRYHPDTASKRLRNPEEHFRQMQAEYEQISRYFDVAEMLGVTLPTTTEASQPEAKANKEPRRSDRTTRSQRRERTAAPRATRKSVTAHSPHAPTPLQAWLASGIDLVAMALKSWISDDREA